MPKKQKMPSEITLQGWESSVEQGWGIGKAQRATLIVQRATFALSFLFYSKNYVANLLNIRAVLLFTVQSETFAWFFMSQIYHAVKREAVFKKNKSFLFCRYVVHFLTKLLTRALGWESIPKKVKK